MDKYRDVWRYARTTGYQRSVPGWLDVVYDLYHASQVIPWLLSGIMPFRDMAKKK